MTNSISFLLKLVSLFASLSLTYAWWNDVDISETKILVFGGNGFLGADTVSELIDKGFTNITIVNRKGKYWDSKDRVFSKVKSIRCDRDMNIQDSCTELVQEVQGNRYDFVLDFSAFKPNPMNETVQLLKEKVGLYILISTDQVYDVCKKSHGELTREDDAVRPENENEATHLNHYYGFAHQKLQVEEILVQQQKDGGFPYVIFRLSDVIGPRDTTYRWWIYQVWIRLSPILTNHPIHIPQFLEAYEMSFVYSQDVAKLLGDLLSGTQKASDDIKNQAFNLALPNSLTMPQMLNEIKQNLELEEVKIKILDSDDHKNHFYTYPSTRSGRVSIDKAAEVLKWSTTDWKTVVKETVSFFEQVVTDDTFIQQRDEMVQIVGKSLFDENLMAFYEALEKAYNIDLKEFKHPRDEL